MLTAAPKNTSEPQANKLIRQIQQQQHLENDKTKPKHLLHQSDSSIKLDHSFDTDIQQWAASQLELEDWNFINAASNGFTDADMQSDAGGILTQFGPSRNSHHRESSLSSMGSLGPASPYNSNSANPHIAITDATMDTFEDMHRNGGMFFAPKAGPTLAAFPNVDPTQAYGYAMMGHGAPMNGQQDRSLLPAPSMVHPSKRSHPASAASSAAGDSPVTPVPGDNEHVNKRRRAAYGNVPKLDRTMTDVYGDELYSPNFTIMSSSPTISQTATSPSSQIFNQRLSDANSQHLTSGHSPSSSTSRTRSPFRTTSPFAPPHSMGLTQGNSNLGGTLQGNERQFQPHAGLIMRQPNGSNMDAPKTISPKDAMLELPDDSANFSLFPQSNDVAFEFNDFGNMLMPTRIDEGNFADTAGQQTLFSAPQPGFDARIPQQYPFVPRQKPIQPAHMPALNKPISKVDTPKERVRATTSNNDGGTYTCTYHGCSLRFESPTLLQKHKREGHRQSQSTGAVKSQDPKTSPSAMSSQAGPHRCDRINPSTGKPCHSIFSRPYDLTRHEDTIHNARKMKVRCDMCTEEKTFSRADALTRHYRVCHPEVDLPGKHRRRA